MRLFKGWSVPVLLLALMPPIAGCGDNLRVPDGEVDPGGGDEGPGVHVPGLDPGGEGGDDVTLGPDAGDTGSGDVDAGDTGTGDLDAGDTGTGGLDGGTTVTCVYGAPGYWKNHAEGWPIQALTLGTVPYDQTQLLSILEQPIVTNGIESLAHHLIAAKLNVANGASSADIANEIAAADALIGALVVPPVGTGYLEPSSTSGLIEALDDFNSVASGCP